MDVSKIVYSHRMQTIMQQVVVDLGLTLTLSDAGAPISLKENEQMFRDLAGIMMLDMKVDSAGDVTIFTFRKRR